MYPNGYVPEINQDARDLSAVLGLKGSTAVSYTHLDVYKRQPLVSLSTVNAISLPSGEMA